MDCTPEDTRREEDMKGEKPAGNLQLRNPPRKLLEEDSVGISARDRQGASRTWVLNNTYLSCTQIPAKRIPQKQKSWQ